MLVIYIIIFLILTNTLTVMSLIRLKRKKIVLLKKNAYKVRFNDKEWSFDETDIIFNDGFLIMKKDLNNGIAFNITNAKEISISKIG